MKEVLEKYYCDRCGKEMPKRHTIDFKVGSRTMTIERLTNAWHYIDICDNCIKSFADWFEMRGNKE